MKIVNKLRSFKIELRLQSYHYFPSSHSMTLEKCVKVSVNWCLMVFKYDFIRINLEEV